MSAAHDAAICRAKAYCLMVAAIYRVSGESLKMALLACERSPVRAAECYRAVVRSLPRSER